MNGRIFARVKAEVKTFAVILVPEIAERFALGRHIKSVFVENAPGARVGKHYSFGCARHFPCVRRLRSGFFVAFYGKVCADFIGLNRKSQAGPRHENLD